MLYGLIAIMILFLVTAFLCFYHENLLKQLVHFEKKSDLSHSVSISALTALVVKNKSRFGLWTVKDAEALIRFLSGKDMFTDSELFICSYRDSRSNLCFTDLESGDSLTTSKYEELRQVRTDTKVCELAFNLLFKAKNETKTKVDVYRKLSAGFLLLAILFINLKVIVYFWPMF